ncbi:hypothetical protein PIN31009_05553 [Pandoraea iniqua]|uniref:hypothetical protein n=1 Tax=Pandoraea iniqua TaxID=2508288 RepID=UPI001240F561|nr:hypothetical protein [Pandoraea iniqua]VVE59485.1 hypothetical protein PIN31009_05553 [Pandoraea iniqua]
MMSLASLAVAYSLLRWAIGCVVLFILIQIAFWFGLPAPERPLLWLLVIWTVFQLWRTMRAFRAIVRSAGGE